MTRSITAKNNMTIIKDQVKLNSKVTITTKNLARTEEEETTKDRLDLKTMFNTKVDSKTTLARIKLIFSNKKHIQIQSPLISAPFQRFTSKTTNKFIGSLIITKNSITRKITILKVLFKITETTILRNIKHNKREITKMKSTNWLGKFMNKKVASKINFIRLKMNPHNINKSKSESLNSRIKK